MGKSITTSSGMVVPKDWSANIKWRRQVLGAVGADRRLQQALYQRCRDDYLLWINLCCWLYEPRTTRNQMRPESHKKIRAVPFVTFEFQDRAFGEIFDAIRNQHDLLMEKSRDEGATWMMLYAFLHEWQFDALSSFMVLSRNKDLVDKRGDKDCLFEKLIFAIQHQPSWMQPDYTRTELHLGNNSNGASIDGAASTGNMGRGGRRTAIGLDEFAAFDQENPGSGSEARNATADNTLCRIFNSTPLGQGNEFFRVKSETNIKVLRLHWTEDPRKNEGLYYDGEGKPRSPWYDTEEKRRGSPKRMAQEVDIDYAAAGGLWFDPVVLRRVRERDVRPPVQRGTLFWNVDVQGRVQNVRWVDDPQGKWRLWQPLGPNEKPSRAYNYVLGADIANGSGASNSVISVGNTTTREKVAEYADPRISPEELGRLMVAAAMFFGGQLGYGYITWEANGPGGITGNEIVLKQNYTYVFFRRQEEEDLPEFTTSHKGGWISTEVTKRLLMGRYRAGLARDELLMPCGESLDEAGQYIEDKRGVPVAGTVADETTGARDAHGDRVIADALMHWSFELQAKASIRHIRPPANSFAGRAAAAEAVLAQVEVW